MPSLNFSHLGPFDPLFDRLGEDAERALQERPDIAMIRCRQLAEVFATGILQKLDRPLGRGHEGLNDWIDTLRGIQDPSTTTPVMNLQRLQLGGNRAVHHRYGSDPHYTTQEALTLIRAAWQVGNWFQQNFGDGNGVTFTEPEPVVEFLGQVQAPVPQAPVPLQANRFDQWDQELNELEAGIDLAREEMSEELTRWRDRTGTDDPLQGMEPWQNAYLRLRFSSIELARRNHQGEQPHQADLPFDPELMQLLLDEKLPAASDPILHFHNRWVISQTNAYRFEDAYLKIEELVENHRRIIQGWTEAFSVPTYIDYEFGALLGTSGQVIALWAWEDDEPGLLDEAMARFDEARTHFKAAHHQARQDSYWGHAYVERMRRDPEWQPSPEQKARWDTIEKRAQADLQKVIGSPFDTGQWHHAFGVALLLKHAAVSGQPFPQSDALAQALSGALAGRPENWTPNSANPYEQIVGLLGLVHPGGLPRRLRGLMDRLADLPGLSGFVANLYRLQWAHRDRRLTDNELDAFLSRVEDGPERRKKWPAGWQTHHSDRLRAAIESGEGPWALLPFNFG